MSWQPHKTFYSQAQARGQADKNKGHMLKSLKLSQQISTSSVAQLVSASDVRISSTLVYNLTNPLQCYHDYRVRPIYLSFLIPKS